MALTGEARERELAQSLLEVRTRVANAAQSASRAIDEITLIAVTKTYPASDVEILSKLGVSDFGENRSSELSEKAQAVAGHWHFQGQIQSNKIKAISSWAQTVHSLDQLSYVAKFDRALAEQDMRRLEVFIQISLDGDPSRAGVSGDQLNILGAAVAQSQHLDLCGLMVVPPVDASPHEAFAHVAQLAQNFRREFPMARYLSAGMSADYEIAIAHGATHIRVGSQILGPRTAPA